MPNLVPTLIGAVAPLPDPPLWRLWLFEQPLPLALLLLVLGLAIAVALSRRGRASTGRAIGSAVAALAVAVIIIASVVETPREHVIKRTQRFVDAAQRADSDEAGALLGPIVELRFGGVAAPGFDRDAIIELIRAVELRSISIQDLDAALLDEHRARTHVAVRVDPDGGFPGSALLRLDWRRTGGVEWRIEAIDCLLMNGQRPGPDAARLVGRAAR